MASSAIDTVLRELEDLATPQPNKEAGYQRLLSEIVSSEESSETQANLARLIDSILGGALGIVTTRTLLASYVEALANIKDTTTRLDVGRYALSSLEPRVASFEDQDARIREVLADAYQRSENYIEAAKALQGIQLESSQRKVTDKMKVDTWIRICRLYLEEEDTLSAESYLNKAKILLYRVEDPELSLIFQLCRARILDSHRKFLEASQAYHSVSLALALADEERQTALSNAIICAVLAPAGPERSRALSKLYKDERTPHVDQFGILEKMFLDRTISPAEVDTFSRKLAPHQLAQTADGSTVLAKAVIEHNLLGASKLYNNLEIAQLGTLLSLDADKAEEYAAHMLEQKRLRGTIDQIEGVIYFGSLHSSRNIPGLPSSLGNLGQWDRHVQGLVEDVERVSSLLQQDIGGGLDKFTCY
ncbi:MAG: hypothetical protein MMC23_009654 [Stictis urceolatum]|nr:hypothetical protein [Stictis urceolata]